jgi:YD repeat-containing protein
VLAQWQYDHRDRLTNRVDSSGVTVSQTYDNLNRVLTRTYPDNATEGFAYSAAGITTYTNQAGIRTTYAYDTAGRKTNVVQAVGTAQETTNSFAYTPASDRLTLVDGKGQITSWGYDEYGRTTNKVVGGSEVASYQYNALGQVTQRVTPAGTTTYTYDEVGNLKTNAYPNLSLRYEYDALNRMTCNSDTGGGLLEWA